MPPEIVTEIPPGPLTLEDRASIRKQVLLLAWPVVIQSLMRTMMFLVDTTLLGHYGEKGAKADHALAATGVLQPISNTLVMVLSALGTGALAIVARAKGEGDVKKQEREAATAVVAGLALGLLVLPLSLVGLPAIARLLSDDPATASTASGFLFWMSLAMPFVLLEIVGSSALRGAGDTRMPMVFALIANVLNGIGNWILIFGKFGAPEMGVVGAGLSTSICLTLQGLMTLAWMHTRGSAVRLRWSAYAQVGRESLVRLARVTVPAVIEPLLLQVGFLIFIHTMASLGSVAMAAHRTAVSIESIAFMPGYGLSIACGALVGQCLGAKRPDLAEEGFRVSARLSLWVMGTLGVIFFVAGRPMVSLLAHDASDAVKDGAALCLKVSAFELPGLALAMVLGGALRGAGDTKSPLIVALIGVWLIRVPLSYVAAIPMKLGLYGAWLTMVVDWGARAGVFWILWKRGRWKTLKL